ncbi:hypothetical protein GCM10023142_09090 [Anaerocolumna aminovalerica]|uniref:Double zinc ribbon n=1 Tax=Anaerocolumna aminovalerica TaxID=1527 RepID=A0A1I5DWG2_9FIRM|nr:hypothetical protein [Anaerocolumna aminovalerica]MBU5332839.1 hypothetical protein [Anaerocolumna aminovalerica]SFO03615.1 hypothetical protein SAMN04489757_10730 [Anaerocolumna aminovalerica]
MRPLKRLKEIIHSNIHTDETNQNEDGNRIEKEESCKDNQINFIKEGMKTVEKSTEDSIPEKRDTERMNTDDIKDSLQESQEEYEIIEREILPEKIICPDCGGITLEGLDFCDKCGGELHIYNR